MVGFVRVVLVKDYFIWGFFSISKYWVNYNVRSFCCNCFWNVVREMNIVISNNRNIVFVSYICCISNSSNLWNVYVCDNVCGIDWVRIDIDFYCVYVCFNKCVCIFSCCYVIINDFKVWISCVSFVNML